MAFEKEQSHKCSLMAALLSGLIRIVFLPVWLVVVILYEAHVILSSRKLGVSATALAPMSTRWLQHQLGLRRDEACAKLIKVLPNHSYAGLYAVVFPVLLGHRLTGFVPKAKHGLDADGQVVENPKPRRARRRSGTWSEIVESSQAPPPT